MTTTEQPTRRRGGRAKPIPFLHIPPDEQKEYVEVSLNGAPTEAEAQLGAFAGYHDTGGYTFSRYPTRLVSENWRGFRDPEKYWFRTYNRYLADQSTVIRQGTEPLLANGFLAGVVPEWAEALRYLAALRFHEAGSLKLWQFVMHAAGGETISYCAVEESGSRLLAVHALNRYALQLGSALPGWNDDGAMDLWVGDPVYRGAREFVEGELTVRDWAEGILADGVVATTLYYQPLLRFFAMNAAAHGDAATPTLISALTTLAERRLRWSRAWVEFARQEPANLPILQEWLGVWGPRAEAALAGLAPLYERLPRPALDHGAEADQARANYRALIAELGLDLDGGAP